MKELINEKEKIYGRVRELRHDIATLKKRKWITKSQSWSDAIGTAKEKEDYVKSKIAGIEEEILKFEAEIEHCYNQIIIINDRIELEFLENE